MRVRSATSASAGLALLFRDHLRANPQRTAWWSELKIAAALSTAALHSYGRINYPAWSLLMELGEAWASKPGWTPPAYLPGRVPRLMVDYWSCSARGSVTLEPRLRQEVHLGLAGSGLPSSVSACSSGEGRVAARHRGHQRDSHDDLNRRARTERD